MIDASAGGSLMRKSATEAEELIEQMAMNSFNWHSERSRSKPVHALYGVDDVSELKAQVASLTAQLTRMQPSSSAGPRHVQMVESTSFGIPSIGYSDLQMGSPCVPNASSSREQVDYVGKFDRGARNFNP